MDNNGRQKRAHSLSQVMAVLIVGLTSSAAAEGQKSMDSFKSNEEILEERVKLSSFKPTDEEPTQFGLSRKDTTKLFAGHKVFSLDADGREIEVVLEVAPKTYTTLEAYWLTEEESVHQALQIPFEFVSAPINDVRLITNGAFDILIGLGDDGDFLSGARGRVVARANATYGTSAIPELESLMEHFFAKR